MASPLNRGKVILQNWDERQKELEALIGTGASLKRSIKMRKYVYLRDGLARLGISPTVDERIYAGIIRAMLKKMLKKFFPNLILRKINEWKERYLIMPRLTKMFKAQREENLSVLDKRMHGIGITGLSDHLKSELDFEREKVELPLTGRFEQDHVLAVTLQLEKDGYEGYGLTRIDASLMAAENDDRKCSIPSGYNLQMNQIINLLKGGAVKVDANAFISGESGEKWLQLDLDRMDPKGNFSLCELILEDRDSIDKLVVRTASEIGYHGINTPEVLEMLKTGARAAFNLERTGRFYVQADPRLKALQFRDEHLHAISIEKLKQKLLQGRSLSSQQPQTVKALKIVNDKNKNKGIEL
ncbi:hypothetical protein QFZ20_002247 [Flavobacterium sp. W4I14]|nr:hypothetical protein [Flavobacterium sp. W4I14]